LHAGEEAAAGAEEEGVRGGGHGGDCSDRVMTNE
jgi:hypothetical protein